MWFTNIDFETLRKYNLYKQYTPVNTLIMITTEAINVDKVAEIPYD